MPRVHAYKNLQTGTYSLRDPKTGLVVGHPTKVLLRDVELKVSDAGRTRSNKLGKRTVHAHVVGDLERAASRPRGSWHAFRYNPFLFKTFVLRANEAPVFRAAQVWMDEDGTWLELYPEDRALATAPRHNPRGDTLGESQLTLPSGDVRTLRLLDLGLGLKGVEFWVFDPNYLQVQPATGKVFWQDGQVRAWFDPPYDTIDPLAFLGLPFAIAVGSVMGREDLEPYLWNDPLAVQAQRRRKV